MLPGEALPGRAGPPGRGTPGRGGAVCGRGIGRSRGCADENGLLPTRGVRVPGFGTLVGAGPGRGAPGVGAGRAGADGGAADAAGAACATGCAGCGAGAAGAGGATGGATAAAGAGAAGLGPAALGGAVATPPFVAAAGRGAEPFPAAAAGFAPPKDSRSRRATGASTVDDADLTNSPCSLSRARTCLLETPSSLANSCTRALPATTSPVWRRQRGRPRLGFSYDAWSSRLHGVLMFFATCPVAGQAERVETLDHRGCVR
jgi:hypothetical protein